MAGIAKPAMEKTWDFARRNDSFRLAESVYVSKT
jgi:hypothetical protein